MSGKDRLIIVLAIVGMLACFTGAGSLTSSVNTQRVDLQLAANEELPRNLPPWIAVTQAMLGSFRGIMVDLLWARAEKMKQNGEFWEANQLAGWITKLQPRFPQVWTFQAWNMAYNISVATHTPQERWGWVQKGISLLRDDAIPLNPNAVILYKELGWIFLHKVGQFSDDMHWYYKQQFAKEWQEVLGAPPTGGGVMAVVDHFRPIAGAYMKYVNRTELDASVKKEYDRLAGEPDLKTSLEPLRYMKLTRFQARLERVAEDLRSRDSEAAAKLKKLLRLTREQQLASMRDPMDRLVKDRPDVEPVLRSLRALGMKPDQQMLKAIAVVQSEPVHAGSPGVLEVATQQDPSLLGELEPHASGPPEGFGKWLTDPATKKPRDLLIATVRANVLSTVYKMDPSWMLELMDGRWLVPEGKPDKVPIPIDWRHPAAHGLYWASLGVRVSQGLINAGDYDLLNTDRQVLHALQLLRDTGHLVYHYSTNPQLVYYDLMPDPDYIDAYHYALFGAMDRISSDRLKHSAAPESFKAGHENFLIAAAELEWFYGDQNKAQEYYRRLRDLYSEKEVKEGRPTRFTRPLEEFVLSEFIKSESYTSRAETAGAIHGWLSVALSKGLVNGDKQLANRMVTMAHRLYDAYQRKQNYSSSTVTGEDRNRMALQPFARMETDAMEAFLFSPTPPILEPLLAKSRAWRNAPIDLQLRVLARPGNQKKIDAMCQKIGLTAAALFPPPPGLDAYRKQVGTPEEPKTTDRQPAFKGELERK